MIQQHVEPIEPKSAAVLLKMWAEQLNEENPDIEHISTRLHHLANSLVSLDEPSDG